MAAAHRPDAWAYHVRNTDGGMEFDMHVYLSAADCTIVWDGVMKKWQLVRGSIVSRGPMEKPQDFALSHALSAELKTAIAKLKADKWVHRHDIDAKLTSSIKDALATNGINKLYVIPE